MNCLAKILSSRSRSEVFRLLFGLNDRELHVREMERLSSLNYASIRQELRMLRDIDLVSARRCGNRLYYKANRRHPLFLDIHRLVLKTVGLVDVLRARLKDHSVSVAFIFGSVAKGLEQATSDIDLFIIGDVGLRDLSPSLSGLGDEIFREVNPYVLTVEEFTGRRARNDHFVRSVLEDMKVFVIGDERTLAAMGE